MREGVLMVGLFLAAGVIAFAQACGPDLMLTVKLDSAVERGADVKELGEPSRVWTENFECLPNWKCPDCTALQKDLRAGERVLLVEPGGVPWRAFYVRISGDDRVTAWAACGS